MGNHKLKNRALTLMELVITVSIISLLLVFFSIKYEKYKESNSLYEAKIKISNILSKYRDLAYYNNTTYTITFNLPLGTITLSDSFNNYVEKTELPKKLKYQIITNEHNSNYFVTKITANGNLSDAFTIYIFDYNDLAQYRIAFYTFLQIKYLLINIYKNQTVTEATFSNLLNYHSTADSQNHVGWIKE